jgi:RNA polymerase sigma-70 factor (ECF subfamily)
MTVSEYNQCVENYSDGLYRFILKNLKDSEKASDIVQESFEKLWRRIKGVAFEKSKSYLFSTAYHTMIDGIRKEKRMEDFNQVKPDRYSHQEQYTDLQEILHDALDRLPEIQRTVILLRDYEGYSYKEIGEITGLSESQVKVYIYRGRVFLKEFIGSIKAVI